MSERISIVKTSGTWRFLHRGIADAENRFSRLGSATRPDDAVVIRVLDASLAVRVVEWLVAAAIAAAGTSRIIRASHATSASWRGQSTAERSRHAGIAVLVAVTTHLLFAIAGDPPTGWYWLILPAIAAAVGLVLVAGPSLSTSGSR